MASMNPENPEPPSLWDKVDHHAQAVLRWASDIASMLCGFGVVVALGLSPLPTSFPLVALARENPPFALLLSAIIAALLIAIGIRIWRSGGRLKAMSLGVRFARFVYSTIVTAIVGGVLSLLFGFGGLPQDLPVIDLLRQRPPLGIAILLLLTAIVVFSPLLLQEAPTPEELKNTGYMRRLYAAITISAISSLLFVSLLGVVVVRPTWCPQGICPAPVLVVSANGVHDANLDLSYHDVQSAFFQLPSASITSGEPLPTSVAAEQVDDAFCAHASNDVRCPAYRQILSLHSLQRGASDSIVVQEVLVTIDRIAPLPETVNVWQHSLDTLYTVEPYLVTYHGQPVGTVLHAASQHTPPTFLHLGAGEGDQIDLGILSVKATGIISYHVTIVYTTSTDTQLHQLVLLTSKAPSRQVILATGRDMHSYLPTGSGVMEEPTPTSIP